MNGLVHNFNLLYFFKILYFLLQFIYEFVFKDIVFIVSMVFPSSKIYNQIIFDNCNPESITANFLMDINEYLLDIYIFEVADH